MIKNSKIYFSRVPVRFLAKALGLSFCALCLLGGGSRQSRQDARSDEGLFSQPSVNRIQITIPESDIESLRSNPRKYVSATVKLNGGGYEQVEIHLKGTFGSFRKLDDKPGLTLNFEKFRASGFSEGTKIHLNNSAEDPSFLNEFIGTEIFRLMGAAVPRVSYARVKLNGRDVGLYVLKEGLTEKFLERFFARADGNLYEPVQGGDIDRSMKNHAKPGEPTNGRELDRAAEAAREKDLHVRWKELNEAVDMDRFLTFMALEVILGHRDGYSMAKNNFRIYHDPEADKLVFIPSGMDQLFGKADLPWNPQMGGVLARAVMETPEGAKAYKERVAEILARLEAKAWGERIDQWLNVLKEGTPPGEFDSVRAEALLVRRRIAARFFCTSSTVEGSG